jgi:uracil-DNA glycosylase
MPALRLTLLVGTYAQNEAARLEHWPKASMTDRVRAYQHYTPRYFPLPHPSWRTGAWERRNPWFVAEILPALRHAVRAALAP